MGVERIDIHPDRLRWAIRRASFSEENAVEYFPMLNAWLKGEKKPTINQLKNFAAKFHLPFAYLFLENPPSESIPFPMFRGEAGSHNQFDVNVYDTVMGIVSRQEWLEEYILENDIETCGFIGSVSLSTPISQTVMKIRNILQLDGRWAFSLTSPDAAIGILSQRLEDAGVFMSFNGIVGNNTHRKLRVSECRGFAMANERAPYIFVNSGDSKRAQLFTIIHEMTHLMLGISAGHAGSEVLSHNTTESYCDMVAAEFLVPAEELKSIWNNDPRSASRRFKASELTVARRAHDLGLMSDEAYREFWLMYSNRPIESNKSQGGGNFYLTSVKRLGYKFAVLVRNAVNNRQLSYTRAYRMTGLYGKTFDNFMTNSNNNSGSQRYGVGNI